MKDRVGLVLAPSFLPHHLTVILLQIVMVSPGTYLLKNHESRSRTSESPLKQNESEIENVWAFTQPNR